MSEALSLALDVVLVGVALGCLRLLWLIERERWQSRQERRS